MKFYHVIDNRRRRNAGLTIAVDVREAGRDKHEVFCGVSYCAPVEPQFSRPRGRIIAQSRLANDKTLPFFKQFGFTTDNLNGLKGQVLSVLRNGLCLDWAASMVDRELDRLRALQEQRVAGSEG